jgi:short-subunit dehydrogenase
MVLQKKGKIMNVASTAAFQPGPMAVYYATKAYVLHFSEQYCEVRDNGITVTALCPGALKAVSGCR